MKKLSFYIISLAAVLMVGLSSCDVTRKSEATPPQAPYKNMADVSMNRDALYALLRDTESPDVLNGPDIMSDLFQITIFDTNLYAPLYNWQRQSVLDNDVVNGYYSANYYSLMQANYFIMRAQEFLDNPEIPKTSEEDLLVKQYIGEAKVIRALAHWRIVQRFARPWDNTTDEERTTGIIVVDKYAPLETAKDSKRSRADVYRFIYQDLDDAIAAISDDANRDVHPAVYITRDYAYAVKARAALTRQDWQTALDCSQRLIDNYPLSPKEEIDRIWKTEDSPEILVRLYTSRQVGGVTSFLFAGDYYDDTMEDGTPIRRLLRMPYLCLTGYIANNLYDASDVRAKAFIGPDFFYAYPYFGTTDVKFPFTTVMKFSGNPSLVKDPNTPQYVFGIHLFNVGEAYLINAEAAARMGDISKTNQVLRTLREARGAGHDDGDIFDPDSAIPEILKERMRELIGEGFRMNDIVRCGLDLKRDPTPQDAQYINSGAAIDLEVPAGDDLMIWEFPTLDMNQNQDLRDNPNWRD